MKQIDWRRVLVAIAAVWLAGCAGMPDAAGPETRAALAPTGKLRVGFLLVPLYATKDAASNEYRGVTPDIGHDLAQKLGVPVEWVVYPSVPALINGAKASEWDVALSGINAERAAVIDFSAPMMEVEQGYLVRAGIAIGSAAEVDRPGVRIGVLERAGADIFLSKELKHAQLIRVGSAGELFGLFAAGKADVVAGTKSALYAEAAKQPGSRVLDGRLIVEPIGAGVPKGRSPAAAQYVAGFVERAKADGRVKAAIEKAGLRGVTVAPPKP
jgi:polar amino acid transport system substrate-binding protein